MTPVGAGVADDLLSDYMSVRGILSPDPGITIGGVLLDFNLVQLDARSSSDDGVGIGIIVTNEDVAAEVPRPFDTQGQHADWLWRTFIGSPGPAAGASIGTFQALGGPVRAKAMRRMDEIGMHVWIVAQTIGLTTYSIPYQSASLLVLP